MTGRNEARGNRSLDKRATQFMFELQKWAQALRARFAIDPRIFSTAQGGKYDDRLVRKDIERVTSAQAHQERGYTKEQRDMKAVSDVFEVSLWWLANNRAFFGLNCAAVLPSAFDDIENKIDLLLEVKGADQQISYTVLAIDETFSVPALRGKLTALASQVEQNQSGHMQYFVSSDKKQKGTLDGIPRVAIGVSLDKVIELAMEWRKAENDDREKTEFYKHPTRVLLLEQIVHTAAVLSRLADAYGHSDLSHAYKAVSTRLSGELTAVKAKMVDKDWTRNGIDYRKDAVHTEVMDRVKEWNKLAVKLKAQNGAK